MRLRRWGLRVATGVSCRAAAVVPRWVVKQGRRRPRLHPGHLTAARAQQWNPLHHHAQGQAATIHPPNPCVIFRYLIIMVRASPPTWIPASPRGLDPDRVPRRRRDRRPRVRAGQGDRRGRRRSFADGDGHPLPGTAPPRRGRTGRELVGRSLRCRRCRPPPAPLLPPHRCWPRRPPPRCRRGPPGAARGLGRARARASSTAWILHRVRFRAMEGPYGALRRVRDALCTGLYQPARRRVEAAVGRVVQDPLPSLIDVVSVVVAGSAPP